jgi:predicted TPR repeat methyltransferase
MGANLGLRSNKRPRASSPARNLDEAVSFAVGQHREAFVARSQAKLEQVRALYERILERAPEQPDALHYLGVLTHQTGRSERSIELIRLAIAARPGSSEMHNNLGNVLKEQGRPLEAAAAYRRAIELGAAGADAESNLGATLKAAGRIDEAIAAFERAIMLDSAHAHAHHNLGNALVHARKPADAMSHFQRAIAQAPRLAAARQSLAQTLHHEGRVDEAIEVLRQWTRFEPSHPIAAHLLAAYSQTEVPGRASDGFVRTSFDALAATFDEHLRDLDYRAPDLVAAALTRALRTPEEGLDVLDAGCGTGLCGTFLRPYARRLIGVDLSSAMLAKARTLSVYDDLADAELTEFLGLHADSYDVIVSADTLCYFGDLGPVMSAIGKALRSAGRLVFTVERATPAAEGFRLHPHGRYSHSEEYVRAKVGAAGLSVESVEPAVLRKERGEPVGGLVVVATLSPR